MNRCLFTIAVSAGTAACVAESPAEGPSRETLPNGAVLVRYPGLPAIDSVGPEITEAHVDLRIGTVDGDDPNYIFGDIRGVQAASDGTIYVLDYQAVEVRAYAPDGRFLHTVVRRGEGPGEIMEANGILLSGDSLLWIHDHGQHWAIIGVDPAGVELRRFTKPIPSYGYIWDGAFDDLGRYWRRTDHSDDKETWDPGAGPYESFARKYFKSFHLATGMADSVYLGETGFRGYVEERGTGASVYGIPFVASEIDIVHPSGGFWHANTAAYRLTRTDEDADTIVVIEAAVPVLPVTAADRSSYVERGVEFMPESRRALEAVAALMPDFKPVLESFFVDDEGRLWVERATPNDVPPFYDLFSEDGDYLGSVRLAFEPRPSGRTSVRQGNIYTWVVDELDTPFVVRAPAS